MTATKTSLSRYKPHPSLAEINLKCCISSQDYLVHRLCVGGLLGKACSYRYSRTPSLTAWTFVGAWPFLVGGVICLLNCDNERDLDLLNSQLDICWAPAS
jgi:hypothetical protein